MDKLPQQGFVSAELIRGSWLRQGQARKPWLRQLIEPHFSRSLPHHTNARCSLVLRGRLSTNPFPNRRASRQRRKVRSYEAATSRRHDCRRKSRRCSISNAFFCQLQPKTRIWPGDYSDIDLKLVLARATYEDLFRQQYALNHCAGGIHSDTIAGRTSFRGRHFSGKACRLSM